MIFLNRKSTPEAIVRIYESEFNEISNFIHKHVNLETGGDLFGTFTHGSMPTVWFVTGPGPNAYEKSAEFSQDTKFTTNWQKVLMDNFGLQYIGTWHSHHRLGLNKPSNGDVRAVQSYARRHHRIHTLEIIVTIEKNEIMLRPYYYFDALIGEYTLANFKMLKGESPIRSKIESLNNHLKRDRLIEVEQVYKRTFNNNNINYYDGFEIENPKLPVAVLEEINGLDIHGVSIEPKGDDNYLLIIPLEEESQLALAIEVKKIIKILQVNIINSKRGKNINITTILQKNKIISLKFQKQNLQLKTIYDYVINIIKLGDDNGSLE